MSRIGSLALVVLAAAGVILDRAPPAAWLRSGDDAPALRTVGIPDAVDASLARLENHGFTIGYDARRRIARWVSYEARPVDVRRHLDRPRFEADDRVADPVAWHAYNGSGYDRGHLAPNYLISNRHGPLAQRQTFLMTNIAPQRPRLNQLVWQRLEEIEVDRMARRWGALQVTVGPVFADERRLHDGPAVPAAFYRLWLDRTATGELRAMAFLVPQSVRGDERLDRFLVSVDRVEQASGLDFYPELPDVVEARLERGRADPSAWDFAAAACMQARYAEDWRGVDGIDLNFDRCD